MLLYAGSSAEFIHDHVVKTQASARFVDCVKNTYRVLLTRGLKGCYVHVLDPETRDYIANRSQHGGE
jgi:DUF2075 family protein